jgi:hypothetical protein
MDPVICCLLGICCPPASAEQRDAFVSLLTAHFKGDAAKALGVADETYEVFAKATKKLAAAVKKAEQ